MRIKAMLPPLPLLLGCLVYFAPMQERQALPVLRGEVVLSRGSFHGYVPPQVGDSLYLNLNEIEQIEWIEFAPGPEASPSYIPLNGPLEMIDSERLPGMDVSEMRFISGKDERWRVTLDIVPYGAFRPPRAEVWILVEAPLMNSIAVVDCEYVE